MGADEMRRLKNWTVVVKAIKKRDDLLAYYQYLLSHQDKHKNQTITNLTHKKCAFNILKKADSFNTARRLGKGGRPSSASFSALFSYPIEIDDNKMVTIFQKNMRKFYRYVSDENSLGLSNEEIEALISTETVGVVHRGNKPNGDPIHNHIHTLIQKHLINRNKKILVSVDLTKKKYLKALKSFNNETISEVMGIELFEYEIKSTEERRKRLPEHLYNQRQKIAQQTAEMLNETEALLNEINEHIRHYKQLANENQTHDETRLKQLNRALIQVKNGNTQRAKKTLEKFIITPS